VLPNVTWLDRSLAKPEWLKATDEPRTPILEKLGEGNIMQAIHAGHSAPLWEPRDLWHPLHRATHPMVINVGWDDYPMRPAVAALAG